MGEDLNRCLTEPAQYGYNVTMDMIEDVLKRADTLCMEGRSEEALGSSGTAMLLHPSTCCT